MIKEVGKYRNNSKAGHSRTPGFDFGVGCVLKSPAGLGNGSVNGECRKCPDKGIVSRYLIGMKSNFCLHGSH